MAFIDGNDTIGVFDVLDWNIKYRIKPHAKSITDFALTFDVIYSVSKDRKVCKIDNGTVVNKKVVDDTSDPLCIQVLEEFIIVAMDTHQICILNPETLLCRRLLSCVGLPKVIYCL